MQRGQTGILIIVGILVVAAIAGVAYFLGMSKNPAPVIQPAPQVVNPQPTPTSESTSSAETANWKTYTNMKYNYSFMYPLEYNPYGVGSGLKDASEDSVSVLVGNIEAATSESGLWYPIFYVNYYTSIIDNSNLYNYDTAIVNKFISTDIGNTVKIQDDNFIRLPDISIGEMNAKVFVNNYGGTDSEDRRIVIKRGSDFYLLGAYTTIHNFKIYNQILSTFKFTN